MNGYPLVYLDNAATTQKPHPVIQAVTQFYEKYCANVHRGLYTLSETATEMYENAREIGRAFLNAQRKEEIIFVRGTTEGINLVAHSFVRPKLQKGDIILLSALEHHSNIVPWQIVAEEKGAVLKVIPMNRDGDLLLEELEKILKNEKRIRFLSPMFPTPSER